MKFNSRTDPKFPFLKCDIIGMQPTHPTSEGIAYTVETRITLQWWRPSYWQWLRSLIKNEPWFYAWPLAIWFAFRYGWQFSTTDPNKRP